MKSWWISRWNRMIFNHRSKRDYWPFESFFIRSFPIRQEVLDISKIAKAFHWIIPPFFLTNPDCSNTADAPSLTQSNGSFSDAIGLGSMRCWGAVIPCWNFTRSHIPSSCLYFKLSVCATALRILTTFSQSHVRSSFYTDKTESMTAYRWLFRDSPPSLRTLWFAVDKSPNFSARDRASPVRRL